MPSPVLWGPRDEQRRCGITEEPFEFLVWKRSIAFLLDFVGVGRQESMCMFFNGPHLAAPDTVSCPCNEQDYKPRGKEISVAVSGEEYHRERKRME